MKQAQEMQSKMTAVQEKIQAAEMEGTAGGGMVKMIMTGKGDLKRITIDPSLLKAEEVDILEDLIIAAHNDAKKKIDQFTQDEMAQVTGGLNLPGGMKLPF